MDIFSSLPNVHKSAQLSRCVAVYSRHFVRRVTHQRPRRRRRRRVYFGPFRDNPDNNGVDQIVTRPLCPSRSRSGALSDTAIRPLVCLSVPA